MKKFVIILILLMTACTPLTTKATPPAALIVENAPTDLSAPQTDSNVDILANLPDPSCDTGLTPSDQEGPYYKANAPERTSLFADGMEGKRLLLAGYVLNKDCFPVPHAFLDFWQANAKGEYDNEGYTLRGHQYTDNKGRYFLETIMPGFYPERPIEHIHVKVQILNGEVLTTQLYFPKDPIKGLTIQLEDKGDYFVGYFNFVVK